MTLNLRSLRTQILINDGTTDLDVSEAFEQLDLTSGVWDDSGWFKPRGTLRLAGFVYSIAESFDCRSNTSRWKPGNVVSISLWYGEWVALPWRLRILRYPNRPYPGNPSIEVEIGTDADLLNYRAPEGDPGGVTYGNSTAAHTLVSAALNKAGGLALGTGQTVAGLSLPFSPSKTDGSSWITYAGQVAYAAGYVLWQHTNGEIRATPLTTEGLTPYAHYVVGRDEADYVPEVSQEQPPERVFVTGTTYRIDEIEDQTENVVVDIVDGVTVRTTTSYTGRTTLTPKYSEVVEQPANLVIPDRFTTSDLITDTSITKEWEYGFRSRLDREVETVLRPRGALFPGIQGFALPLRLASRTTITYTYPDIIVIGRPANAEENRLAKKVTRLEQSFLERGAVVTRTAQITTEQWEKVSNEEYIYRRSQVNRNGDINPLPTRRGASTNNQPPATQYKPSTLQREELTFTGTARFTNLAGSGYADKLWSITLPSGMATSNAQCAARARTWGSIRQGRQFAISWAADLERGWLENFNPVRRIDFTVPEVGRPYAAATAYSTGAIVFYRGLSYRALSSTTGNLPTNATYWEPANIRTAYLIEALNISIDARSAAIGGRGLEVGRISTNAALPALPSTPGAAPTPGIPDPVPPFDVLITIDIQHQVSVSPLTFAATTTSAPAAAHDVSVGQLTFAAASRVYWVAQHAASVRPLTFAAAAGVRPDVQHDASVGALTFAAAATARPFAQHEVSVSPLTFAAEVAGPILVQHDVSVGPLTFAAEVAGPLFAQHEVSVGALTFAAAASSFESETNTLLAALSGTYDGTRQAAINTLIAGLKTDGLWSLLDVLCIAGLNSGDSLINWKTPGTFNSSAVNSPAFVADRGFTAASSGSRYIDTNYNPTSAAGNYTQNSASIGFYSRTNVAESSYDMGTGTLNNRASIFSRRSDNECFWRINDSNEVNTSNSSSQGLILISRTSSSSRILYRDGSQLGTNSTTSAGIPNGTFYVGAVNFGGNPQSIGSRQYAMWFMAGGLSGTNVSNFYSRIQTYMTAIGANV